MFKKESISDEQLVEKVRQEDKQMYSEVIKRYEKKLLKYANYLIFDSQKAIDVVWESFVQAFINLNSFDARKKFSSWIYRIVHNQAINMIKKTKREIPLKESLNLKSSQNIEEEYSQKETDKKVKKCLRIMATIYSEPLALFFLERKTYEEIGDILRISMGTVATRINRAKVIMKQICQKK